eukprot:gnl/MRDRNA2_/MRDRNA2_28451_c0_seq1.p1 gnl/MRDRNA2_/MRDRNA2_28451_c0~~gnl/MRDRNA2_/MRDRNA2_28451_c0_seq1.p1  ORF type:complete len:288 (+),score=74.24 gnl/MRDRNA2_/MRDRNA2_28451_c0_seq1:109-972(+)
MSKNPPAANAKSALQIILQKRSNMPMTKATCQYKVTPVPGEGFQGVLEIAGVETKFEGEVAADKKTAEMNAAQKAVDFLSSSEGQSATPKVPARTEQVKVPQPAQQAGIQPAKQAGIVPITKAPQQAGAIPITKVQEPPQKKAKTEVSSAKVQQPPGGGGNNPKCELNSLFLKIFRTDITKDALVYNTSQAKGGYQCAIRIPQLPGYQNMKFTGEVASNMKDAESSAAGKAVQTINADADLQEVIQSNLQLKAAMAMMRRTTGRDKLFEEMAREAATPLGELTSKTL